jgi:hypothetical protein
LPGAREKGWSDDRSADSLAANQARPSFLKKRSKRLLQINVLVPLAQPTTASRKSHFAPLAGSVSEHRHGLI